MDGHGDRRSADCRVSNNDADRNNDKSGVVITDDDRRRPRMDMSYYLCAVFLVQPCNQPLVPPLHILCHPSFTI